jgi:hypothetical protein
MHPSIAFEFLKKIPRLETVALMIAAQQNPAEYKFPEGDRLEMVAAKLGAEILSVAIDFDQIFMTRIGWAECRQWKSFRIRAGIRRNRSISITRSRRR